MELWKNWLWGIDESDDPEPIDTDEDRPEEIAWRPASERDVQMWNDARPRSLAYAKPDANLFQRFADAEPESDGYYWVIWEPGKGAVCVYLRKRR